MRAPDRFHRLLGYALALGVILCGGLPLAAQDSVLGSGGQVYRVLTGSYGELMADSSQPAKNPVLALEVFKGDRKERWLVPGTEGPELESSPSLSVEPSSGSVYLIWNSTSGFIHSQIRLARFSGSAWSEVIEISGNPFSLKLAPRLAVTRQEVAAPGADPQRTTRTVLHTVWWEELGAGWQIVYAPIELRDDAHIGFNQLYALSELAGGSAPSPVEPAFSLVTAPAIERGVDGRSVVAAIIDPQTGELVTLRIRLLPAELSELALDLASYLESQGARLCAAGGLQALAAAAGDRILARGDGFRSSVRRYLAEDVRDHLLRADAARCNSPDGVTSLAEEARAHIILIGVEAPTSDDVGQVGQKARAHIILIGVEAPGGSEGSVAVVSRRPAPETGEAPTRVYLSPDGRKVLVAWQSSPDLLRYRESQDDEGWGPIHKLVLDQELGTAEAHSILELRVRSR